MSELRKHHPYSPSKLQALEASPLYEGKEGESEASTAGTTQHEYTDKETIDIDDPALTDKEYNAVMACRSYRDSILATYRVPPIVLKEAYVRVDDEDLIVIGKDNVPVHWLGTTAGYLDLALIGAGEGKRADLFDWKFGLWSVEPAETNLQGIAYLLSLVKSYPSLEQVTVHFCMPHRDEIDSHTFYKKDFPMLYLRVKTVVARAIEARKLISAGGPERCTATTSSCLFCARLGNCKIAADFCIKVGKKYDPVLVPANVTPSLVGDMAESGTLMEVATLMEAWSKAVKRQITEHAIDNKDWVPDRYKFMTRADLKVKDYEKFREEAIATGISPEALDKVKEYPLTKVCKMISDAQPRGEKEATVKAFRENLTVSGIAEREPEVYFLQRIKS